MSTFVVDTNVPVVANGNSEQADPDCVMACVDMLTRVHAGGTIVLDDSMQILAEYMKNLNMSGQPGLGDLFMKWAWNVQADEAFCELVRLTPRNDDPNDFLEFPDDPELADFDPSDRKFVAVALASQRNPTVLNAVDSDWAEKYDALKRHRVVVSFICPQHVCPK